MRRVAAILPLLIALLVIPAVSSPTSSGDRPLFYARVDYLLTAEDTGELAVTAGSVKELYAPPEPPGYKLYYVEVFFEDGLPRNVVPVTYDSVIEERGEIKGLVSLSGDVAVTCKDGNATLKVKVKAVYLRREWVPITCSSIKLTVKEPEVPFSKEDLTVKVTIENHAPYAIVGVKGPGGVDLTDSRKQESLSPDAIQVDPKHVVLSMRELPLGDYEILLSEGEDKMLPSAFIAAHEAFHNETVPPGASRTFSVRPRKGWKQLAYIVILYSLEPARNSRSTAVVEADIVDYAYSKDEIITVKGASFLIPPLNLRFWIKAYIAFGSSFRVINGMESPLSVMYVPVLIKEAGDWTPEGVFIDVAEDEIETFSTAYIVVQVPSHGRIVDVITPSGDSYGEYRSALKPWFSALRGVGVLEDEAYIQVKAGGTVEAGEYFFKIEWKPLTLVTVDSKERPIPKATITVAGPLSLTLVTDPEGSASAVLYEPGIYDIEVSFRGYKVATVKLGTIIEGKIVIRCEVYDLTVVTVNLAGRPLEGTEVSLMTTEGVTLVTKESDEKGIAALVQIPKGRYVVRAVYKRIEKMQEVEVDGDKVVEMKLDVLFEIPFLGIPVSSFEAAAVFVVTGATALVLKLLGRGREYGEEELEELEVGFGD